MGLVDSLGPVIKSLMLVLYGIYCLLGVVLTAVGILIAAKKLTGTTAWGMIFAGVAMLLIGAACVYVVMSELWFPMMILQIINFVLFLFILSTGMIAFFIGAGYSDPVTETYDELYEDFRVADGAAGSYGTCYQLADGNDITALDAGSNWDSCRAVYFLGTDCTASDAGLEIPSSTDVWTDYLDTMGNCSNLDLEAADSDSNTWKVINTDFTADCGTAMAASASSCDACDSECKSNMIQITKKSTKPIAVGMLAFWFYFCLVALINNHVIQMSADDSDDEEETWADSVSQLFKILIYVFDGLVILFALIVLIIGVVGFIYSSSEEACPMKNTGASCPGGAFMVISIIGFGLLLCGAMTVIGLQKSMKFLLVIANTVFILLCIGLLACVVLAGLATGVFGAATVSFDSNYISRRDEIRGLQDDDEFTLFCAVECAGDYVVCDDAAVTDGNCGSDDTCYICQNNGAFFSGTANCMADADGVLTCTQDCLVDFVSCSDVRTDDENTDDVACLVTMDDEKYPTVGDYELSCTTFVVGGGDFEYTMIDAPSLTGENSKYCDQSAANTLIRTGTDCAGVVDCDMCYWKEEINGATDTTADTATVMCLSCAANADGDAQYPDFILGNIDSTFKTSDACTSDVSFGPLDDIYGPCSSDYTYEGCKAYTGPQAGWRDTDADECKEDIREKVEDYMRPLGIVALVVCLFFVGIMYFTQLAIDIWKAGGDDEDDDDDE
jgi:hypothetical protein